MGGRVGGWEIVGTSRSGVWVCGWWTGGYSAEGEYVGGSTWKRREGGLHPSNGTREPLSNRCRGGARSPRWLLRTLMSFSLAATPSPRRPPPGVRVLLFHLRRCYPLDRFAASPPSSSLYPSFVSASLSLDDPLRSPPLPPFRRLSHDVFPLSPAAPFSRTPRGGHDTCQSTADARSIPTDLGFSLRSSTSFFALSPTTILTSST